MGRGWLASGAARAAARLVTRPRPTPTGHRHLRSATSRSLEPSWPGQGATSVEPAGSSSSSLARHGDGDAETGPCARACSHPTQTARGREACVTGPDRTSEPHNHPTPPRPSCRAAASSLCLSFTAGKGKSSPGSILPKAASFPPPRRPLFRWAFQSLCVLACSPVQGRNSPCLVRLR